MKKLLFTITIMMLGFTSIKAQENETIGGFSKGDLYISGKAGFSTSKQGEAKSNSFNFSPSLGYFVNENIAVEASLIIGSSEDTNENKTNSFGGALGATYFFTPANQFSFNVGLGLGFSSNKFESNGGFESKVNGFVIAVSPGVNYFVSDSFALRASVGALSYATAKGDWDGAESSNSFGLNLDLSNINFGISYNF